MDCQRIDSVLDGHGLGALSAAERRQIDAHLGKCRRCADAWFSHEVLACDTPEGPKAGLFEAIADRVAAEPPAAPAGRSIFGRAAWAAGAAAVLLAAAVVYWGRGEEAALPGPGAEAATTRDDAGGAPRPLLGGPRQPTEQRFLAGRDYERLPVPAPTAAADGRIEVCEFFMFWCVHCFELEAELDAWSETKPDYVDLVRIPALFNATARLQAQAFYTAEALGLGDAIRAPFYDEIHVRGNPLATRGDIKELFARFGIAGERFDEVFDSFGVRMNLQRAEELNRRYRVSATPSMGINGKYLTNASMTGTNEAMLEVVDSLVAAEAPCRGDAGEKCLFE